MLLRCLWTTLLAGLGLVTLVVPAGACGDCGSPCGGPALAPPCAPAAPAFRTVSVNVWVPETYEATRTVMRTEWVTEKYTAYRCVMVPQTRTQVVTVNRMVPEEREIVRTVCEVVPSVETRTVMKPVVTCKPVTTVVRKCVDMGHWECRLVPDCDHGHGHHGGGGFLRRLCGRHRHEEECCEPCGPPPMKVVRVWCPNKVWVEQPVTTMARSCEYVPVQVQVTVCRTVARQVPCKVTVCRCVPVQQTVNVTCMVPTQVPYEATRCVPRCVPVVEKVQLCRMVCRTVEKQVPVVECCAPPPCCEAVPCCASGGHHRRCGHHRGGHGHHGCR
jgi:hypothetical protein